MKKRIVIAEDNSVMGRVLEHRLRLDGYDVTIFPNGEDALEYMSENPFDLLITDLYMPYFNGLDIIQEVRKNISGTVPIIAISVVYDKKIIKKVHSIGADDFIIKPFFAGELSVRVKRLIEN